MDIFEGEENTGAEDVSNTEESSSSPEHSAPEAKDTAQATSPNNNSTELPFHEHPRWKEVMEQKNEALSKAKALEERYAQMEARLTEMSRPKVPEGQDKRSKLIERLKGIDPEFAEVFAELTPSKDVEQLKQQYQEMQRQSFVNDAVNTVNKLHAENKVSPELQAKYNAELDLAYRSGQIKSQADVSSLYKNIHEGWSKLLENIKRAERESYVAAKKTDAKTPTSQPKGSPAKPSQKQEWAKDPEERRAQIVAKYLKTKSAEAL